MCDHILHFVGYFIFNFYFFIGTITRKREKYKISVFPDISYGFKMEK